jgi:hypothetical protein
MEFNYESRFTHTKFHTAITSGGRNIAPSQDGLGLGFYKATCPNIRGDLCPIFNHMFSEWAITTKQKQGTIVCLPKTNPMLTPVDRRPIILVYSDYKIVTRIIAQGLRPVLENPLSRTQYYGVPGNTNLDAVTTVRDTIAYAESTNLAMCVLALDF